MSDKKIEAPNYTQIPNVYFDYIMQTLNQTENIVFLVIMRKTFGWHKKKDNISYSQIMELTGIKSRSTISTALKGLIEKELVEAQKKVQVISYTVSINELVQKIDQSKNCTGTSPNSVLVKAKTSPNSVHTKESNINKIKKNIDTQAEELADLLYTLHLEVDSKYKADWKKWETDIEKIHRIDGRTYEEIERVIKWCKTPDNFWFPNICSGKKLREKFATLKAQMMQPQKTYGAKPAFRIASDNFVSQNGEINF